MLILLAGTHLEEVTLLSRFALQVAGANVLMIGAGGIGCELIKTLVMTGFRNVTMVRSREPDIHSS